MRRVLQRLLQWIRAVPVVGFNSQRYNLIVLKSPLIRRLVCVDAVRDSGGGDVASGGNDNSDGASSCFESDSGNSDNGETDDDGPLHFVVKRSNALTVVETRRLRFLDITNFIAPGSAMSVTSGLTVVSSPRSTFPTSGWIRWRS